MSTGEGRTLAQVLQRVADEARPARLPPDLWSRGRRSHRRRVGAAVTAAVVLVSAMAMPAMFVSGRQRAIPAQDQPSIPSRVYPPMPFPSTVQDAPAGPAALIVTGPGGFGASDSVFGGYEDRAIVVGQNGSYRVVRHINAFDAGESVLLSPDGRYVASDWGLEGARPGTDFSATTAVLDLTTGRVHTYDAGQPLAWSPGGRSLLARSGTGNLSIVDVTSGAVVDLGLNGGEPTSPSQVSFAPDGRRAALRSGRFLHVIDLLSRTQRQLADLGDRRLLAGPGAWTADGRIAIWNLVFCGTPCRLPGIVGFELSYVDAEVGTDVDGPRLPAIHGGEARLLGWQSDGDAVVVLNRDHGPPDTRLNHGVPTDLPTWQVTAPPEDQAPEVVALHPGGGSTTLVTLPRNANRVDIAADLLDRFGGPTASLQSRFLDWLRMRIEELLVLAAVVAAIVGGALVRRRRRTGFWRYPTRRR